MLPIKNILTAFFFLVLATTASAQEDDTTATAEGKQGAKIALQFNDNDSMHVVTATVTDSVDGTPLAGVDLTFNVKRSFGLMQVGEGTTDSLGTATAEFKRDIRSDVEGKAIFITRIEDNDAVNNTEVQTGLKPDLPYLKRNMPERAMFARKAPWWLVLTFTGLVGTVWFIFAYILFLIKKIRSAGITPHQ